MEGEYYKTKASVKEYIRLAKGLSGIELIEKLKIFLDSNSKLLELGSGPGTDWEILNQSFNVTGSDNSKEFLQHLKKDNPEGEFIEIDAISILTEKLFDGIYSNKVLHHLKDDEIIRSIEKQYQVLKEKGIICHSFWAGEGSEIFKGLFVNYHSEEAIKNLFKHHFEILLIERYKEFDDGDSILLIGRKRE